MGFKNFLSIVSFVKNTFVLPLLDLLFPKNCTLCHSIVIDPKFRYLCSDCLQELSQNSAQEKFSIKSVFEDGYLPGFTFFTFSGVIKEIIHQIKYNKATYLRSDLKQILSAYLIDLERIKCNILDRVAILVPVPLFPKKQRQRGFNQSILLAQILQELVPTLKIQCLLRRTLNTKTQTQLKKAERKQNVASAFAFVSQKQINLSARYILIDDVLTTGATLSACASVLRKHGLQNLSFLTLAHG